MPGAGSLTRYPAWRSARVRRSSAGRHRLRAAWSSRPAANASGGGLRELHLPGARRRRHRQRRRGPGPAPKTMTHERDRGQRCTGGDRQHRDPRWKTARTRLRSADFGFTRPARHSGQRACCGEDHHGCRERAASTGNGVPVSAGRAFSAAADIAARQLEVHVWRQRQRRGLRGLQLPGAGSTAAPANGGADPINPATHEHRRDCSQRRATGTQHSHAQTTNGAPRWSSRRRMATRGR